MRMFISFSLFYVFYFVSEVLCTSTDNYCEYSMRNNILFIYFIFYSNNFIFLLFNNLMSNWHCISIKTRSPQK
jgi:hypothetical protein